MPDVFNPPLSCPTFSIALLSFPTFLIGNPCLPPRRGHTNKKGTEEKNTGFPLTTGGNNRGGTGGNNRGALARMTEGTPVRMTKRPERGRCHARRFQSPAVMPDIFNRPSVIPDILNRPLSFPTFLIGNPRLSPRRSTQINKGTKKHWIPANNRRE